MYRYHIESKAYLTKHADIDPNAKTSRRFPRDTRYRHVRIHVSVLTSKVRICTPGIRDPFRAIGFV